MRLTTEAQEIVRRLAEGWTLKVHRPLDGQKKFLLPPLGKGDAQVISEQTVRELQRRRLISSNMKFPAATYLLTERGQALAGSEDEGPLTSRNWR